MDGFGYGSLAGVDWLRWLDLIRNHTKEYRPSPYQQLAAAPGTACSTIELIGLGLPLGPTGLRTRCDLDTETTAGQAFTVTLWVVQAAVWGLATLAIAGYTGLIRKTA